MTMGFIPDRFSGGVLPFPAVPAVLTPLSATLVHSSFLHLALNLLILAWCGSWVERVLGAGPLVLLYVVSAFVAAFAQWLVGPHDNVPMIGASGAISGVIGAFALSFGRVKTGGEVGAGQPAIERRLAACRLGGAAGDDRGDRRRAGDLAGDRRACRRLPRGASAAAAAAAVAVPEGLGIRRGRSGSDAACGLAGSSGSSSRWRWTITYFISASSTVICALPRQASSASA